MKAIIVYDNTAYIKELKASWGFSCLIEAYNKKILFDTGGSEAILQYNMRKLNIDVKEFTDIFISHNHSDHTGGLPAILKENSHAKLWIPASMPTIQTVNQAVKVKEPIELYDGIYST